MFFKRSFAKIMRSNEKLVRAIVKMDMECFQKFDEWRVKLMAPCQACIVDICFTGFPHTLRVVTNRTASNHFKLKWFRIIYDIWYARTFLFDVRASVLRWKIIPSLKLIRILCSCTHFSAILGRLQGNDTVGLASLHSLWWSDINKLL